MATGLGSISLESPPANKISPSGWVAGRDGHDGKSLASSPEISVQAKKAGRRAPVHLTWEDLSVTAASESKTSSTAILAGVTGFARPGEVLAIMGPSGCGKTTLLDTLAGRLTQSMNRSGIILVNGQKQTLAYGTSAYVTQEDVLMTTLTVQEAIYYSAQLQLPDCMSGIQKRRRAEKVMVEMGLKDAMNTIIGGRSSKGVSGGQRRRVSICIEILTRPKLLFLDEPTSGLDSAASYHVMNIIVNQARRHCGTVIISIHQPSSEVFELFDNLCLLCSGTTVYFGPTSLTAQFFAANGFPCPQMRNPCDHFLRTINKDFDMNKNYVNKQNTKEAIDILTNSYNSSNIYQDVLSQVAQIRSMAGDLLKKGERAGFITQCLVLTRRSSVNMWRDLGYYRLRLLVYIIICLSIGTLFFDIGSDYGSIQARCSMLSYISGYLTFMAIGGFPSFVEDLKIFKRERLNGHYSAAAFTISNSISSLPFLLLISVVPAASSYYLTGLQTNPQHFAFFALIIYSSVIIVEGLMMIVAAVVPDFLMGIITGAGIQGWMILASGFFRLPRDMPKTLWVYPAYYIAFQRYATQGLYKNEFIGLTFPGSTGGTTITGIEIVRDIWQMQAGYSKWVDLLILLGMGILYRLLFWGVIRFGEGLIVRKPMPVKQKQNHIMEMSSLKIIEITG
ncbi:ABC transporter G family member 11 [Platanthera zijinensis]|uniref:ABC transporter G family member 11 n=1 Tax=Platanthera zijinensis TaxID=2320716 RepID=A0AAP0B7R6_9ASPA